VVYAPSGFTVSMRWVISSPGRFGSSKVMTVPTSRRTSSSGGADRTMSPGLIAGCIEPVVTTIGFQPTAAHTMTTQAKRNAITLR
jgi:hypothetical protein